MKIVADRSIPFIKTFFKSLGQLSLLDTSDILRSNLLEADILVTRTVTTIDKALLEGTPVKLVASTSSGYDHIDVDYLRANDIGFAHAPGCNARSVAEYVLSSIFVIAEACNFKLTDKKVGIIGCGNVGSTVLSILEELGMNCLVYDPPRQKKNNDLDFCTLEDIQSADIITLHVPLVTDGPHQTMGLVDQKFLSSLKSDVVLINSSRGSVVDEVALVHFIDSHPDSSIVLDVWKNEPDISLELLKKTTISTPHIAGYSLDGRFNGTSAIFKRVCEFFDKSYTESELPNLKEFEVDQIKINNACSDTDAVQLAVLASYDVRTDSAALRQINEISISRRSSYFSDLRTNYPLRREFNAMNVKLADECGKLRQIMENLGFGVS